ncbi:unnamed protein product, partial [Discosporangium mesarthrocarpum]
IASQVTLSRIIMVGLTWGVRALAATVAVDSLLWARWLWPEGRVLLFNTADNRSSEWGVHTWHWWVLYFTSALPRAMTFTALLVPLGLLRTPTNALGSLRKPLSAIDWEALLFLLPALSLVSLYSALPHKELRFIFPALPLLNAMAGLGVAK